MISHQRPAGLLQLTYLKQTDNDDIMKTVYKLELWTDEPADGPLYDCIFEHQADAKQAEQEIENGTYSDKDFVDLMNAFPPISWPELLGHIQNDTWGIIIEPITMK